MSLRTGKSRSGISLAVILLPAHSFWSVALGTKPLLNCDDPGVVNNFPTDNRHYGLRLG